MGGLTRVLGGAIVALVVVGLLAAVFAWRAHGPADSPPPAIGEAPAHATPATPALKPAPKDSVVGASGSNTRLRDAYLFFLAALAGHRPVGR